MQINIIAVVIDLIKRSCAALIYGVLVNNIFPKICCMQIIITNNVMYMYPSHLGVLKPSESLGPLAPSLGISLPYIELLLPSSGYLGSCILN
jgi:hypothetical protein